MLLFYLISRTTWQFLWLNIWISLLAGEVISEQAQKSSNKHAFWVFFFFLVFHASFGKIAYKFWSSYWVVFFLFFFNKWLLFWLPASSPIPCVTTTARGVWKLVLPPRCEANQLLFFFFFSSCCSCLRLASAYVTDRRECMPERLASFAPSALGPGWLQRYQDLNL